MILFCTEKWCSANPSYGLTNNFHNLFNTFSQSRSETYDTIHLDECNLSYQVDINSAILVYTESRKVDVIIFSLLGDSDFNPDISTYYLLKKRGIKLVFMWPDTSDWAIKQIKLLDSVADLSISWDNPRSELTPDNDMIWTVSDKFNPMNLPLNHIMMWVPQDDQLFRPVEQDIPVSFIGSIYPDRASFLDGVKTEIFKAGGQRGNRLTAYEYADLVRRSKISINFAGSPCQTYTQCKGRVYEILASKGLLLESKNKSTSGVFVPGIDYVEFSSVEELDSLIEYYLNNEDERIKIATSGFDRYQNHTSKKFWNFVLNRIVL